MMHRNFGLAPLALIVAATISPSPAEAQPRPIDVGRIALTSDVTMYSVGKTGSERGTAGVKSASQKILARGNGLKEVRLDVAGTGSIRVTVGSDSNSFLADAVVPIDPSGTTKVTFEVVRAVQQGEWLTVLLRRPGGLQTPFTVGFSKDSEAYVFSDCVEVGSDLNMVVVGVTPMRLAFPAPRKPKALVILLENGGFALAGMDDHSVPYPTVRYATCPHMRIDLVGSESLEQMFQRGLSQLMAVLNPDHLFCYVAHYPLPPYDYLWNPVARQRHDEACRRAEDARRARWTIHEMSFEEWWMPVSDTIAESITQSVALAQSGASPYRYDKVVVLQDERFEPDRVLTELARLSADYDYDLHLLCHGGPNSFQGGDHASFEMSTFFLPLMQGILKGGIKSAPRAVYQMNCSSGTLVAEWLAIGARAVCGTGGEKINSMPTQYFHFLQHWMANETFQDSVRSEFQEARGYYDVLYALAPEKVEDSRHFVFGRGGLRITSN
ncbi:MAG: hypothetical protein HYZ53_18795 [Planctomycetes bacterium]|nr:hypothetical protein [Planctomycetota bacterium]